MQPAVKYLVKQNNILCLKLHWQAAYLFGCQKFYVFFSKLFISTYPKSSILAGKQGKPVSVNPVNRRQFLQDQSRLLQETLESNIVNHCSDGLCVKDVPGCGKGLFATKNFLKGDFICVYTGDLMTERQYNERYGGISQDKCYTFHFQHDSQYLVVDATNELSSLARMANHSWKRFNAEMRNKVVKHSVYLVLFAAQDIRVGHEIRYNYGDTVVRESGDRYEWLREITDYN